MGNRPEIICPLNNLGKTSAFSMPHSHGYPAPKVPCDRLLQEAKLVAPLSSQPYVASGAETRRCAQPLSHVVKVRREDDATL